MCRDCDISGAVIALASAAVVGDCLAQIGSCGRVGESRSEPGGRGGRERRAGGVNEGEGVGKLELSPSVLRVEQ